MGEYSIEAELKANASKYKRAIQSAKRVTEKFKKESESIKEAHLDADASPLKRNLKKARKMMNLFARNKAKAEVDVSVDDSEAKRKMGFLMAVKTALNKKVVIPIEARINNFQQTMGRIANSIQAFGTVAGNTFRGLGIMVSSSLVPIIASMVPAIMAVGNTLGVVASGAVALGAAFGIAGSAAIAYGAAAAPTIKSIIDGTAESTKENLKATKQLNSMKSSWEKVQEAIAPQVASAFGDAMAGLETIIDSLSPMFESMADTVTQLSDRFKTFFESSAAQSFFDYLNTSAAPILEKLVNGISGFIEGLMNLTVAFAPLTDFMSAGFESMGKSFVGFTQRVAGSKELESFIQYVKENLPIIRGIFGDVFKGIINLFVAFSDNSSTVFDSLSSMATKFREWSSTIAKSDGFQKFIQYVQENGPKVVDLIGNVITFIVNLGIALAPMGAKILELSNQFISWTNSMMESYPMMGQIIAWVTVLSGALIAFIPNIVAFQSAFGGAFKAVWTATGLLRAKMITGLTMMAKSMATTLKKAVVWAGKMVVQLVKVGAKYAWLGIKSLIHAAKIAASWFIAMGPVGWVIAGVIALAAIIIANWDKIVSFTKKLAKVVSEKFIEIKNKVTKKVAELVAKAVMKWQQFKTKVQAKAAEMLAIAKMKFNRIKAAITSKVREAVKNSVNKFIELKNNIQNKIQAAKRIVQEKFEQIRSAIRDKIQQAVSLAKQKFDDLRNAIKNKIDRAKAIVQNGMDRVKSIFDGLNLYKSGKAIIQSAIDGLNAMKSKITGTVENIVGAVRDFWPFSPAKRGPLSDIHRMDFGGPISNSIKKAKSVITKSTEKLAQKTSDSYKPDLKVGSHNIRSSLRGLKRKSAAKVQSGVNASVEVQQKQPANINVTIGRNSYRAFVEDITNEQELRKELQRHFS